MIPLPAAWSLIRRFWWLIPATAILVTAGVYRIQRDNARENLAAANAAVAALEAAGRVKDEEHRLSEKAWQRAAERLVSDARKETAAVAADNRSLAGLLRQHAARACGSDVPAIAGGAGGADAAIGGGGGVSGIDAALDRFRDAARACGINERFWLGYGDAIGVPIEGR